MNTGSALFRVLSFPRFPSVHRNARMFPDSRVATCLGRLDVGGDTGLSRHTMGLPLVADFVVSACMAHRDGPRRVKGLRLWLAKLQLLKSSS